MIVLGIETSCDETAVGIVADAPQGGGLVLAHALASQLAHAAYGGVVPEIAARAHLEQLGPLAARALGEAGLGWDRLDAVAATVGPGLVGGLAVGAGFAKAACFARGLRFVGVNHLEAHALTVRLGAAVAFPYLLLLVSGGHCQLLVVEGVGRYARLGTTIDDAAGEAFDKGAKLIGLGYPGGPAVERWAARGDPKRFPLPRPMLGRPGCDFSFSGLKTALRLAVERLGKPEDVDRADLAAALQAAIAASLIDRTRNAARLYRERHGPGGTLVAAGGVAANGAVRAGLEALAAAEGLGFVAPPEPLCTDNGVMVAWAGLERLRLGLTDPLDLPVRPRWPLDPAAAAAPFAGAKA